MWLFAFHSVSGVSHRCTGNAFGESSLWVSNCKPWVRQLSLWLRAKGRTWWRTESCSLEPCLFLGRWKVVRVLCSSMWMICLSWQNTRVMSRPNLIWLGPMRKAAFFFWKVSAEVIMSFYVASMALHDIRTCSTTCRKPFYLTGAILLLYFSWQAQHFGQKCDVVPSPVECHFAWQAQLSVTPYTAHPVHSTFNSKLHNLRTHTHTPHCTF